MAEQHVFLSDGWIDAAKAAYEDRTRYENGTTGLQLPSLQSPVTVEHYTTPQTVHVNGQAQTQPFKVLIDPNVAATGVTPADLVEQYQHAVALRAFVAQVQQLTQRVRTARDAAQGARRTEIEKVYASMIAKADVLREWCSTDGPVSI